MSTPKVNDAIAAPAIVPLELCEGVAVTAIVLLAI
jgi:hypothetical protein